MSWKPDDSGHSSPLLSMDFFCVGPQRTASSWLQEVLALHPQISLPEGVKETMFFDMRFEKGLDWYAWHFRRKAEGQLSGEIAPTYFSSVVATQRISMLFPAAKVFILLRNPVDRAYSLYRHHLSKGRIRSDFERALDEQPELIASGRYSVHAPRWENSFASGNVHYIWNEEIATSPDSVLNSVTDTLGIDRMPLPVVASERINSASAPRSVALARIFSAVSTSLRSVRFYRVVELAKAAGLKSVFSGGAPVGPMRTETKKYLLDQFEPDIRWLENRFNRDLSEWRAV